MNYQTIVLTIIIAILAYLLYVYYFSKSNDKTLVRMQDARESMTISPGKLPSGSSTDYTYSVWFYVNDWNYRIGQDKIIFARTGGSSNKPAPVVSLGANSNDLNVSLETYTSKNNTTINSCQVTDVPLQRWVNLIMSINGRALDLYIDGKLVRTCVLDGVPKVYPNAIIEVCPSGGFSGYVSNFRYIANAINPSQAYDIYKSGYGGGSAISGLFNKYRVKFSFVEDNKEINSFEL